MNKVKHLQCSKCGLEVSSDVLYNCPTCGIEGTLDVRYDMANVKKTLTKNYLKENKEKDIWRYMPILPISGENLKQTLQIGNTPLYKPDKLKNYFKMDNLYLKDEGRSPTGSFKDRASAVGVYRAIELGKDVICAASTGNAASSLSGFAACLGIKNYIFVPKAIPEGKLTQLLIFGSKVVLVDGDYDTAFDFCLEAVDHFGWYNRSCAINPYLVEGKKTAAFEIIEQLDFNVPDKVVMSVGDGCSISGVWKGFKEFFDLGIIDKLPQMICVQGENSNPVNRAYNAGKFGFDYVSPQTIADSISVGIPRNGYKALTALKESNGVCVDVSDTEILEAMTLLAQNSGVFGEPAGVAGFAGFKKLYDVGKIKKDESVVLVVSGNGLKDIKTAQQAVTRPEAISPDLDSLVKYLNI